jgi:hypothetical protein
MSFYRTVGIHKKNLDHQGLKITLLEHQSGAMKYLEVDMQREKPDF